MLKLIFHGLAVVNKVRFGSNNKLIERTKNRLQKNTIRCGYIFHWMCILVENFSTKSSTMRNLIFHGHTKVNKTKFGLKKHIL